MTLANSIADSTLIILKFRATAGFDSIGPPTVPTLIGSSIFPTRLPSSSIDHFDNAE